MSGLMYVYKGGWVGGWGLYLEVHGGGGLGAPGLVGAGLTHPAVLMRLLAPEAIHVVVAHPFLGDDHLWVGGWVGGWVEEIQAVRMRCWT